MALQGVYTISPYVYDTCAAKHVFAHGDPNGGGCHPVSTGSPHPNRLSVGGRGYPSGYETFHKSTAQMLFINKGGNLDETGYLPAKDLVTWLSQIKTKRN